MPLIIQYVILYPAFREYKMYWFYLSMLCTISGSFSSETAIVVTISINTFLHFYSENISEGINEVLNDVRPDLVIVTSLYFDCVLVC